MKIIATNVQDITSTNNNTACDVYLHILSLYQCNCRDLRCETLVYKSYSCVHTHNPN